jgi:hypothetical protein
MDTAFALGPVIIIAAIAFGLLMLGIAVVAVIAVMVGRNASK